MTGSGKSRLTKKLLKSSKRNFIIDVKGEYSGSIFDNVTDIITYLETLEDYEPFTIVCRNFSSEQLKYFFEIVYAVGKCVLCLEEFEYYFSNINEFPFLDECIRRGREHKISLICVSQRVPDFPPDLRSQCNSFVSFKQMETVDLQHLNGRGFEIEKVPNLEFFDKRYSLSELQCEKHYLYKGEHPNAIEQWFTEN